MEPFNAPTDTLRADLVSSLPLQIVPRTSDAPRCRRCASLLVVTQVACDDGAVIAYRYCPVCQHEPRSMPRAQTRRTSILHDTGDGDRYDPYELGRAASSAGFAD